MPAFICPKLHLINVDPALDVLSQYVLKLDVPTGSSPNAANQTADLIKTTLTLPSAPLVSEEGVPLLFTTLEIKESAYTGNPLDCTNGAGFSPCFQSTIEIDGLKYTTNTYSATADLLKTELYVEPAAAVDVKEQLIKVYYDGYFGGTVGLPSCSAGGSLPCVEFLQKFKTQREVRDAPTTYPVAIGGVLAIVKNNKNGILGLR